MLNIITNGYVLPFISKPSLVRFPLIRSEYKALQKDQALATCIQSLLSKNAIERVENVKSFGFYSCQASPKVEASNRLKQAQHFSISDLSKVVHSSSRSICHSSETQTSTVRGSSPRPKCLGHRCSEHKADGSHSLCLPCNGSPSQGDPKNQAMPLPDHRNSPRLAMDALVLGPSAALNRDPTSTSSFNNSSQTVPQLCVPQQSTTSQPPRLVSRSGQLQEQGFCVEVAEIIAVPQRSSTRTIYKSKWVLFEKWCRENLVDFSTPSVKHLNRRPSTIDGYRTAIVDTLGPAGHHISQSSDLHRLLSSFHTDRPKIFRNLPKWNLSVVLNELTKAPFMKDTDLKHLTLKTAFLLALASGKRRSEIHACVANKVSNLGQWKKIALFLSSDFIAKNQLAREGSQSVSLVTIPALTTIVDKQFKEDRTLCPVRALRYYLDRTKDLRGSRSLLFIAFKKGHTSDYSFFLVETNRLVINKHTNKPWTWSKLKRMTLGPLRPLRPFTVGYRWTKSCKPVTGKLTTHLLIFT